MTASLIKRVEKSIFADYFQIYVMDSEAGTNIEDAFQLFNPIDKITKVPGLISIGTVRPFQSNFAIEIHSEEPAEAKEDQWDAADCVTEATLQCSSGKMQVEGCSDTTKGRAAITLDVDAETIYKVRILSSKLRELSVSGLNGNDTYTVYAWPTDTELLETTVHKRFMPVDWKKNPDTRLAYFANPPLGQSMFKELMFIVHGTDDEVTDSAKSRSAKAAEKFFQKRCPKEATPFVILSGSTASEPHFKALNADAAGDLRAATSTVRPCAKDGVVKSLQDVCDILTNNRVFSDEHPETLDTGIPDSKLTKADAGVEGIDEVVIPVFAPKDDALAMAVFVADALSLDSSEKEKLVKLELGDYDCVIVGKNGVEVIQA